MAKDKVSIKLKNNLSELTVLNNCLERFTNRLGLVKRKECEINLILEELITNIISYGYEDKEEHWIDIKIAHEDGTLIIRIEDDGIPFNPVESEPPDTEEPIQERDIGGVGIHLTKHFANKIEYKRTEDKNIITLKKELLDVC